MAYCVKNYKFKRELLADLAAGKNIEVYQPGPFGPTVKDGTCTLEGPHFPHPHTWYAQAEVKDGVVVKVK